MREVAQAAQSLSLGTVSGWTLVALVLLALIKGWPALKKMQLEADGSLRADLLARVAQLETRIESLEKLLTQREAEHAVELADVRHELANETQSLDAFILLAEANPDRVIDQLPKIKEMRTRHKERVALRRGVMARASINEKGNG